MPNDGVTGHPDISFSNLIGPTSRAEQLARDPLLRHADIIGISHPVDIGDVGVYFLISRGTMVYVGQSGRVRRRIQEHRSAAAFEFDRWAFVECAGIDLLRLEARYINAFQPVHNNFQPPSWPPEDDESRDAALMRQVLMLTERPRDKAVRLKLATKRQNLFRQHQLQEHAVNRGE